MTRKNSKQSDFMAEVKAYERAIMLAKKPKRGRKMKHAPKRPTMTHRIDPRIVARASKMGL
jgi:hypothetical protein